MDAKAKPSEAASEKPRIKMQLYKTEPCQNWVMYGVCRYGNLCKFAHGMTEQRSRLRHPKYKTSLCKDFPLGKCTFGNRCNFAHSLDELRSPLPRSAGVGSSQQAQEQQQLTAQQQMLLQTPVRMLPGGRMLSSFTPVSANSSAITSDTIASNNDDARGLRRYQSMGTLRALPVTTAPLPTAPALPEAAIGNSTAFGSPTQPLLHLRQEQNTVARRVASLSQLPTLRPSGVLPPGSAYLQGLGTAVTAYVPTSPLVHHSPAMSSSSPEYEVASIQPSSDSTLTGHGDWPGHQSQYLQPPDQRRMLTSSISMQTLPRFKAPVAWDAQPVSSALATQNLHTISSQSSATLIDSDVWAATSYSPLVDSTSKPQESRFFPAPNDSASAASPRLNLSSPYSHHQLRRQQSTDDWAFLRGSQNHPSKSLWDSAISSGTKGLFR
ncbi:hypothetical protein LPJ55_005354 [Coemansia sp. RSA 990]|nr:hypothetical protein LPJ55_005354 [Coemansia sp. RSA 990]KAJ2646031.1 hypothetical protein IWW40_005698 [Coemansia sp. RSA 1250]KAJ2671268.1 hypothetical protein IWW42_003530 [Coemansia sp. RSA 1085]